MKKRKICIVTGTRAEYGILSLLMKKIKDHQDLQLQIIATNMHLSPEFGLTYRQIEQDGFQIDKKVEMLVSSDTAVGINKSLGLALIGFADAYNELKPDMVLVLGDRYELVAAVNAANIAKIPVAHLHGGEITEGAFDNAIRHSITKLSHLHFTSTEEYRNRVIQMGEDPQFVYNVGALGVELMRKIQLLNKEELENELDIKLAEKNFLITYHPATLDEDSIEDQFSSLLKVLRQTKDANFYFTYPNSDTGGRIIIKMINDFVEENPERSKAFISLGQLRYLSLLKQVKAVVGNSSSGIIEAPSFHVAFINIGDRQAGRAQAGNVIACTPDADSISKAFQKLNENEFIDHLKTIKNPYEKEQTSDHIIKILASVDLSKIIRKKFYDINFKHA